VLQIVFPFHFHTLGAAINSPRIRTLCVAVMYTGREQETGEIVIRFF
jgi:hypothetical protein